MSLKPVEKNHEWIQYPAFYNVNPIHNEVSYASIEANNNSLGDEDYYIDTFYGRIFNEIVANLKGIYGPTEDLPYYTNNINLDIVDELRVPFRKIPIYLVDDQESIRLAFNMLEKENQDYQLLYRGQTKSYQLDRDDSEKIRFYGSKSIKEPSFLPSHLRTNFDPLFLQSMWQNQIAILFNDIGFDYQKTLTGEQLKVYQEDIHNILNTPMSVSFSLGVAQHYGLPSIGLDLTSNLKVASWFATNTMDIRQNGETLTSPLILNDNTEPTIYIFRCPKNTVFDYKAVKPRTFPIGRPDRQDAWFGHVGWGAASNQLASYLMCGFRLSCNFLKSTTNYPAEELFPKKQNDPILDFFIKMRGMAKYEGEAKRALSNVYHII